MCMTVALIFGGAGFERQVSLAGARFVYPLISREKYSVIPIFIAPDGRWLMREADLHKKETGLLIFGGDDPCDLRKTKEKNSDIFEGGKSSYVLPDVEEFSLPVAPINLGDRRGVISESGFLAIDVAFPLLHGDFGEDGIVQGALENAMIKFVGEDAATGAICLDKRLCHLIAHRLGIPTAKGIFADKGEPCRTVRQRAERIIGYPLFIKPCDLGSSVGAFAVLHSSEFGAAYESAASLTRRGLMIEELVDIDAELEIGVLLSKGKQLFTNIGKIKTEIGFYDYKEKYESGSSALVEDSPKIDEQPRKIIGEYARRLSEFLHLSSLCRLDFFLTGDGRILFNEINTMPGFTETSLYPRLASSLGLSPRQLIDALICEALL